MADRPVKRVVRRMDVGRPAGIDEQLWPVNVALLLLAAFVEGVIIARLDFGDPRLLYNAWTWTATLLLSVGFGVWLVQRLDNRRVRRSVQLATVLSLLFHVVLVVLINKDYLLALVTEPEPPQEISEPETFAMPVLAPNAPPQDFERPPETPTPDDNDRAPARNEPPVEPKLPSEPTPPAPMPEQPDKPNLPKLPRPEPPTPRQNETPSQRSRNDAPSPNDPQTRADAPRVDPSAQPRPRELDAPPTPSRRDTAGPQTPSKATEPPTTAAPPNPDLPSRDRQQTEDIAQSSRSPTPPRRESDPVQPPTTAVPSSDLAGTPRQTAPSAADPQLADPRREPAVPSIDHSADTPTPRPNENEIVRAPNAPRRPPSDEVAPPSPTNPSPRTGRAPPSPDPAAVAAANGPQAPSNAAANVPPLESSAPITERSAASNPATPGATSTAPNSVASQSPPSSAPADGRTERPIDPGPTGAVAQATSDRHAPRAPRVADSAGSPAPPDRRQVTESGEHGPRPSPEPGNVAEQRSTSGVAGQGRSPNFDSGPGALQHPGPVASDSSVRPTATQDAPDGSAISPTASATVGRRRADANLPSSSLQAENVPQATRGGSKTPSFVDADAALANERANARAPRGSVSADRGAATVDVGPRQVIGEGGSGRPSGGGQPDVGDIARGDTPPQRTPGRDRPSSFDAASPAAIAAAPRPSGAAGTSTGETQPQPAAVAGERSQSSPSGAVSTAVGGDAPSGALASDVAQAASGSGRPSGAAEEMYISAPGVDGRRAAAGGIPEVGPATPPQLAGGPTGDNPAAGNPASAGTPDGAPLDQQGPSDERSTAGLAGRSTVGPAGAADGPAMAAVADVGRPGDRTGRRDPLGGVDAGAAIASVGGGSPRRTHSAELPSGLGTAEAPTLGSDRPTATESGELPEGALAGQPSRRDGGPRSFVQAEIGPGGLGAQPAVEAGIPDRRARTDTPDLAVDITPHALRQSVGLPAIDGQVRNAIDTYRLRRARRYRDAETAGAGQPSPKTEEAVESGLDFLARSQSPDGSWSLHDYRGKPAAENCRIHSNTAATGLALLAYLGAAYDHYDDKYHEVVRGGLDWLVAHQQESGDLYLAQDTESSRSARLYSHAIATIALCEAYGMTGDPRLKEPAQRAIDFIVRAQHREFGGWRYSAVPGDDGYDSDTSVSGWMMMALRSAELAKLDVPKETFTRVEGWLQRAASPGTNGSRYVYDPKAQEFDPKTQKLDKSHGRYESPQMTSIALLMRMYLGWDRTKPEMVRGADYLAETLPTAVTNATDEWQGAYYWYYATQVMFHMRGEHWRKWNERLHPLLTNSQRNEGSLAGSWDPDGPASDTWGRFGGRIYVTTLNLLSLEVYYRYLPIYEDTAR
ncbi:MAG: hypothetical protein WD875_06510 [Pirellulales bacterium]